MMKINAREVLKIMSVPQNLISNSLINMHNKYGLNKKFEIDSKNFKGIFVSFKSFATEMIFEVSEDTKKELDLIKSCNQPSKINYYLLIKQLSKLEKTSLASIKELETKNNELIKELETKISKTTIDELKIENANKIKELETKNSETIDELCLLHNSKIDELISELDKYKKTKDNDDRKIDSLNADNLFLNKKSSNEMLISMNIRTKIKKLKILFISTLIALISIISFEGYLLMYSSPSVAESLISSSQVYNRINFIVPSIGDTVQVTKNTRIYNDYTNIDSFYYSKYENYLGTIIDIKESKGIRFYKIKANDKNLPQFFRFD